MARPTKTGLQRNGDERSLGLDGPRLGQTLFGIASGVRGGTSVFLLLLAPPPPFRNRFRLTPKAKSELPVDLGPGTQRPDGNPAKLLSKVREIRIQGGTFQLFRIQSTGGGNHVTARWTTERKVTAARRRRHRNRGKPNEKSF